MYIQSKTFTKEATVSSEQAKADLLRAYPGFTLAKFDTLIEERPDGSEKRVYVATIQRYAGEDGLDGLPPEISDHSEPDGDEGPDPSAPSDNDGDEEEPKEEKSEGGSLEDKIDKLISIVEKLVKSDKEVHKSIGKDDEGGEPRSKTVDTGLIPDPVPAPFGAENSPKKDAIFSKTATLTRKADVTIREAVAELRADIAAGRIDGIPKTAQITDISPVKGEYIVLVRSR